MNAEKKWTEGPWKAGNRYGAMYAVEGPNERGICSTGGYSSNKGDQDAIVTENRANAHLIAAAPELYEALGSLLMWTRFELEGAGREDRQPWARLLHDSDTALAKARGEAPKERHMVGGRDNG